MFRITSPTLGLSKTVLYKNPIVLRLAQNPKRARHCEHRPPQLARDRRAPLGTLSPPSRGDCYLLKKPMTIELMLSSESSSRAADGDPGTPGEQGMSAEEARAGN